MYLAELEVKDTTKGTHFASYIDLLLSIEKNRQFPTSIYDKRDDFSFHITTCPFLSINLPSSPIYGVFISQLYDTPGLASRIIVYSVGQATFK